MSCAIYLGPNKPTQDSIQSHRESGGGDYVVHQLLRAKGPGQRWASQQGHPPAGGYVGQKEATIKKIQRGPGRTECEKLGSQERRGRRAL